MSRMVQSLLDLARIESGQFKLRRSDFFINDLIEQTRESFAVRSRDKNILLLTEADPGLVLHADRDRLAQVLTNLVENAFTHTPPGGTVELHAKQEGECVVLAVSDNGKGIAANDIGRIFERFYQADKSRTQTGMRKGTGLGLAIAREIIETHDGTITVDSTPGHGSTFTVTLPRSIAIS